VKGHSTSSTAADIKTGHAELFLKDCGEYFRSNMKTGSEPHECILSSLLQLVPYFMTSAMPPVVRHVSVHLVVVSARVHVLSVRSTKQTNIFNKKQQKKLSRTSIVSSINFPVSKSIWFLQFANCVHPKLFGPVFDGTPTAVNTWMCYFVPTVQWGKKVYWTQKRSEKTYQTSEFAMMWFPKNIGPCKRG